MKKPLNPAFVKQAEAIKRFVSFKVKDKTIKPKSLADKVRRYYHLIYGKGGQPGLYNPATDVPTRLRGKSQRKLLDSEGQPYHRSIKVAFVESTEDPNVPGKLLKPRIRVKGGRVLKSTFDVTTSFYRFRPFKGLSDDDDDGDDPDTTRDAIENHFTREVNRILRIAPGIKSWVVKCGKRQTGNPKSRTSILVYVLFLLGKYQSTVGDWMTGLVAFDYDQTSSLQDFLAERNKLRTGKSGRKAKRRNAPPRRRGKGKGKK